MRQNSKVSSALTAEAARWRDASISAWMSPSSADGAADNEMDALRLLIPSPPRQAVYR